MKILKVKCLAPTRLDNYLTQQYPALTPGRLNKALRENKIMVIVITPGATIVVSGM